MTVVTPNQLIAVKATVARVERVLRVRIDDYWPPGPGEYVFLANEGVGTLQIADTGVHLKKVDCGRNGPATVVAGHTTGRLRSVGVRHYPTPGPS